MKIDDPFVQAEKDTGKVPNQKELEKELSEYLSKKYGSRIKIVSPFVFPRPGEDRTEQTPVGFGPDREGKFNMLPEDLEEYLDSYVVKQSEAKSVLATKICTHFNRIKHTAPRNSGRKSSRVGMIKNNVLMIGPTGVGKTYIVKLIAEKLGVPFVKGDATKFSETGYVGGDVEDLVRDLVYEAGEDIALAENGIIYVDEIDKIASARNIIGHDVSRTGVQRALLKPMEETDVDLKVPHDPISQIQAIEQYRKTGKKEKQVVNTRNILFIMSGAFGDLAQIIKKRLQKQGLGFEAKVTPAEVPWEILKEVTAQDLIEFGFESEFVGRLPVIVVFDELTKPDLVEILNNPNNPIIISKRLDFRSYGIDIAFETDAIEKIAEMAAAQKTGARGLVSVIEKVLIPFEKRLPSTGLKRFLVTLDVVTDPEAELRKLLAAPHEQAVRDRYDRARERELQEIESYILARAGELAARSGLRISEERTKVIAALYFETLSDINSAVEAFMDMVSEIRDEEAQWHEKLEVGLELDDGAVDEIILQAIASGQEVGPLAFQLAKRLEYGLKLVRDRSDTARFTLTREAVTDMEGFINDLIKRTYSRSCPSGQAESLEGTESPGKAARDRAADFEEDRDEP